VAILLCTSVLIGQPKKKPAAPDTQAGAAPQANKQMTPRGAQRAKFTPDQESTFEAEKKNAVIVAPNYRDSGLASLRFTYNDAAELRSELERQGYNVHIVPSTEATADGIREALARQKTYLDGSKQATLIFAFMGHGFSDTKGKNYLMTYGADPSNMDKEALSIDEVENLLNQTGARRKVIFIDACRSVAGARGGEKDRTMTDFKAAEGMSVLLATKPGAYSYEDPELSHGVFTYFLLEGLRGKAAGQDGFVTFSDLSAYVQKHVSDYAEKKDMAQKPLATMKDVGGDFLMATAAPAKSEDIKPVAAASLITSDTPVMRALGGNQSFFVTASENNLTLLDALTGQPYAILREDPTKLGNQDEVSKRSLRWFSGDAPKGERIDAVLEMHGNDMLRLWGRTGKLCPGDKPCSQVPYPLLPGEVRSKASVTNTTVGKAAKTAGDIAKVFGKSNKTVTGTAGTSAVIDQNGVAADTRDKFIWSNFDLASTLKSSRQASVQGQKP
jgi:hypothetical protein